MNFMELAHLIGRTAVLWLTALAVFRFMGKRTLGKMGPFDFAVSIMLGEAVAIGMEDVKTPLVNAIAITLALGVLQWLLTWLNARFRWLEHITQGVAVPVVTNGRIDEAALRRERMTHADLFTELRQNGARLKDIKVARLEPTGRVSVVKNSARSTTSSGPPKNDDANDPTPPEESVK